MFKEIGQKIIQLASVDSTNNYVASMLKQGKIEHGTVILADEQSAGRGQREAKWQSRAGENLLMSIFTTHDNLSVNQQFVLSQIVALSIIHLLNKYKIDAQIKWPNDILVNEQKIAGILIENQINLHYVKSSILGIGLNVNQKVFDNLNATSIQQKTEQFYSIHDVLMSWISSYNQILSIHQSMGKEKINELYLANLYGYQEKVDVEDENGKFQQKIDHIDEQGNLWLMRNNELKKYDLKEIKFLFRNTF